MLPKLEFRLNSALLSNRGVDCRSIFRWSFQAVFFSVAILLRRGQQVKFPQVWVEEGEILKGYFENGFFDILVPVNGYLIVVPKVISAFALHFSLLHYPLIATLMAIAFSVVVLLLVANSPLQLQGGFWLSMFVIFVPSDPEVFGVSLYTFWWSTLLLFLVAVWTPNKRSILRFVLLILAGASGPVIVLCFPVFLVRAIFHRGAEWLIAVAAGTLAAIQLSIAIASDNAGLGSSVSSRSLVLIAQKFFGDFLIGNFVPSTTLRTLLGVIFVCFLLCLVLRHRSNNTVWVLVFLVAGCIGMSCSRVDIEILDPVLGGPRYFFFPYSLTAWMLVHFMHISNSRTIRNSASVLLMLSFLNMVPVMSRPHQDLEWKTHIASAANFDSYDIPIQYDGDASTAWVVKFSRVELKKFADDCFFDAIISGIPTFPYRQLDVTPPALVDPAMVSLSSSTMTPILVRHQGNLVFLGDDATPRGNANKHEFMGSVRIQMKRGDSVLYSGGYSPFNLQVHILGHSGFAQTLPAISGMTVLEFSSIKLPDSFEVVFQDRGQGKEDWFVIGLAHNSRAEVAH